MPARLLEPFSAAACEEKNERSESPGVAEKLNRSTVMSKSKPSRRARYCTGSTMRSEASMPSDAEILDERHVVRLERRLVDQEFDA